MVCPICYIVGTHLLIKWVIIWVGSRNEGHREPGLKSIEWTRSNVEYSLIRHTSGRLTLSPLRLPPFPITVITDGHGTLNRIYVFVEQIEFYQNVIWSRQTYCIRRPCMVWIVIIMRKRVKDWVAILITNKILSYTQFGPTTTAIADLESDICILKGSDCSYICLDN